MPPELHAAYVEYNGFEPGPGGYTLFEPDYEQSLRASAENILAPRKREAAKAPSQPAPPERRDESTLRMYIRVLEGMRQKAEEELAALTAA